jgi:glycosyltransferase involved in cell wall biosynthesis
MATTDVMIDRRILLEADSLITKGYEVIVLAWGEPGIERFQAAGRIKIERYVNRSSFFAPPVLRPVLNLSALNWKGKIAEVVIFPARVAVAAPRRIAYSVRLGMTGRSLGASELPRTLDHSEFWLIERLAAYDPDVIHVHDLPQLRACAFAKEILRCPLVYDAHELYPEISTLTAEESRELSVREREYIRRADHVITVNRFIAEEMALRYGVDRPAVIWNAIDPADDLRANRRHAPLRERLGLGDDISILLFQGMMSRLRGLQPLVRSMALVHPAVHLVLLGYGNMRQELQEIARECRIEDRVHFVAAVPWEQLLYVTATADAGIIPYPPLDLNTRFCSPNKLFEYIQAGVPIIANDLPFLREVVAGEDFGVVAPLTDPRSFADAISAMFDRERGGPARFRPQLAAKREKYTWRSQTPVLHDIYAALAPLDGRGPHSAGNCDEAKGAVACST